MNDFLFTQILTELEDAVGRENCSVREIDKVTHSVDYFWLSRMWADRGRRMPEADYIVSPKNAQETSKVLKIANYYKIPVTTWGGGGGTQGGAIPVCGGILLDTKRMNEIYEVNTDSMYIECGAGAIYKHIEWAANEKGYATMHYPSSLTCSTVGGFLAHRGIGVVSTKYGKIDDMVLQMEVVLPKGVKELVDVEEKILLDTFKKYGAEDLGSEYGEKWWKEKITFFYPGNMMDLPQMFGTMDTIAPYDKIEKIYWAMKKAVETNFPQAKFIAHFSHWYEWGCMVYDRFIIDDKDVPKDPAEAMRLHNAMWNLGVRTAIANGGVVNDHHGVGIKLGRLMKEQYGPAMQVFEGLKKQLDPNGIMNPFKLGL